MLKKRRFNRICKNIEDVKIQGATNVAKAALKAYFMFPSASTKKTLLKLRPTEPMLTHVLHLADKQSKKQILAHFNEAQDQINKQVLKLIKKDTIVFTHCHSTNVIRALIYAKQQGKKFQVYNTETRPLYQGRKTTKELTKAKIPTTQFVDAATSIALKKQQKTKKVSLILLGADALLKNSVINKVGSGTVAQLAKDYKIPLYIVADSWKYSHTTVKLEQRDFQEVWPSRKVHIKNPAFEPIPSKQITKIITELGTQEYDTFVKQVSKRE